MVTVVKSLDPNSESKCETKAPLSQHMLLLATACSTLTSQSQQSRVTIGDVDNKINEESRIKNNTSSRYFTALKTAEETLLYFPDLFSKGALVPQSRVWCRENSGQV